MSEQNPDEGAPPRSGLGLNPRTRLPFEQNVMPPMPGFKAAAFIYGVAGAIMAGVAGYMAFVVGHPMISVAVIAPALGALYFFIRLAMMLRPKV